MRQTTRSKSQRGVALLIAIFALLLISGVAISLMTMSATESSLAANYKRNVASFYAAQAGVEEARARLVPCAPDDALWPAGSCADPQTSVDPLFSMKPPTVVGTSLYIINPLPGEVVDPKNPANPFYDFQYQMEFGETATQPLAQTKGSSAAITGRLFTGLPPMTYKWARINLKSELMAGVDLDGNGVVDNAVTPVRARSDNSQCVPAGAGAANCPTDPNVTVTTAPIYRITAMAMEANGSERMVQAEVALPPDFNPNGAISSKAGVTINGNFNAFGGWPPVVSGRCGNKTIPTCGTFSGGAVQVDCTNPYDPTTDTCNGKPRSHKDYCNKGDSVNGVSSAGNISSGNYDQVPDSGSSCTVNGPGCISTVSPNSALAPNTPNWPYNMDQIIATFKPISTDISAVDPKVACGTFDSSGNRTCQGQGAKLGTLPNPWPVPPNTTSTNDVPAISYAQTGPGGLLKLTGASSGAGVLVVEGDVSIEAGFQWYGLIVVRGVVTFLGGGATPTNIVGGIIAGSSVTNATTTTGGSVSITYSSCAFRKYNSEEPLRYLGFREISRPRPAIP